jgi:hypothetical protein
MIYYNQDKDLSCGCNKATSEGDIKMDINKLSLEHNLPTSIINELLTLKANTINATRSVLEQSKQNEKAVASGQVALLEKAIVWLENNNEYRNFWEPFRGSEIRRILAAAGNEVKN